MSRDFLYALDMPYQQKLVMVCLAVVADDLAMGEIDIAFIAESTAFSEKTVRRHLRDMHASGLIARQPVRKRGAPARDRFVISAAHWPEAQNWRRPDSAIGLAA